MHSFLPGRIAVIHFITAGLELTRTKKREHCAHLLTFLYWVFDKQDTSLSLSTYFTFSHLYIYVTYYWWSLTCFPLVLLILDMVHWGLQVERPRAANEDIWRCTWSNVLFYYQWYLFPWRDYMLTSVSLLVMNINILLMLLFSVYVVLIAHLSGPGRGIPHLWLKFLLFT